MIRVERPTWRSLVVVLLAAALPACSSAERPAVVTELSGGPDYPLFDHTVTWTGDAAYVIGGAGGDMNDGLLVDEPLRWTPDGGFEPIASPPGGPRNAHAAVWTGSELLVWSGSSRPYGDSTGLLSSTVAYDPSTDTWRQLADSPERLAKLGAVGAMADRFAVFAGEYGSFDAQVVAIYDTEADEWHEWAFGSTIFTVAGDGRHAFVLGGDDRALVLGSIGVDDAGGLVTRTGVGPSSLAAWSVGGVTAADVAVVDDRVAVVVLAGDHGVLLVSSPITSTSEGEVTLSPWTEFELDLGAIPLIKRELGVLVVGERLVWSSVDGLAWLSLDGDLEIASAEPAVHCAMEAGSTSVGDAFLAVGGNCTFIDENGGETYGYGSVLVEPPLDGD